MSYRNVIRWYIKWWWVVGIIWLVSFFFLFLIKIGKYIRLSKDMVIIIYFPLYINSLFWNGLNPGPVGYLTSLIFFLIPCYLLARILKLFMKVESATAPQDDETAQA